MRASVAAAERAAGWGKSIWFETTREDTGHDVAGSAVRRGADVVLAVGGDGTVRAIAEGMRGGDVPLALLPSGTGNLLARNLDLPLTDLDAAVELAFSGVDRQIDLGMARIVRANGDSTEHAFLVMAGIGLDAKMIKNTSRALKKAVGWLAYIDGIARSLPELKPLRVAYRVDDGPTRSMSAHTIIIGNCGLLPGGLLLMPQAKPDDGLLDVAALRPRGPFGWAKVWRKVAWENGVLRKSAIGRRIVDLSKDVRDVTYLRGRELNLSFEHAEVFQLDGDAFGEIESVRIWVEPGALTMRMPAV